MIGASPCKEAHVNLLIFPLPSSMHRASRILDRVLTMTRIFLERTIHLGRRRLLSLGGRREQDMLRDVRLKLGLYVLLRLIEPVLIAREEATASREARGRPRVCRRRDGERGTERLVVARRIRVQDVEELVVFCRTRIEDVELMVLRRIRMQHAEELVAMPRGGQVREWHGGICGELVAMPGGARGARGRGRVRGGNASCSVGDEDMELVAVAKRRSGGGRHF